MSDLKVKTGTIRELTQDAVIPAESKKIIEDLNEKIKSDSNNTSLLIKKAFIYFDAHADGKAIDILEDVIKIDPNCIDAYVWLAEIYIYGWGDYKMAKKELLTAKKVGSRPDIYKLLADVYRDEGDKSLEKECLEKALKLGPDWILPRISLIYYYIFEGNLEDAKKELKIVESLIGKTKEPTDALQAYYENLISGRTIQKDELILKEAFEKLKRS